MRRPALLVLLALVALSIAIGVAMRRNARPHAEVRSAPDREAMAPVAPRVRPETKDETSKPTPAPQRVVRGIVRDVHDAPIVGAEIVLTRYDTTSRRFVGRPVVDFAHSIATARTGDDGRFEVDAASRDDLVLVARKDGFVGQSAEVDDSEPTEFVLVAATQRELVVVDEKERAVAGAQVTLVHGSSAVAVTNTDEQGHARLQGSPQDDVEVCAVGFVTLREDLADFYDPELQKIVLCEGRGVAGTVVDGDGRALSGAVVKISNGAHARDHSASRATDVAGAFEFDGLDPSDEATRWILSATLEGRAVDAVSVTPGQSDVRIVMRRAGTVRGVVTFEGGSPAAGADVGDTDEVVSDDAGRFEWVGVAPGHRQVHAERANPADERARLYGSTWVDVPEGGVVDAQIVLAPPRDSSYLLIRVVNSDGRPVPKAPFNVLEGEASAASTQGVDANGVALAQVNAPPGTPIVIVAQCPNLSAEKPKWVDARNIEPAPTRAAPPFEFVEVKAVGRSRIKLRLVDPEGREIPFDPAFVDVGYGGPFARDGTLEVDAGDSPRIEVCVPGFASFATSLGRPQPALREETIRLTRAARVTGRVVAHDGAPLADPSEIRMTIEVEGSYGASIPLDDDGRFDMKTAPVGRAWLHGSAYRTWLMIDRVVETRAGETLDLGDIRIAEVRRMSGRVTDGAGRAIGGARAIFLNREGKDVIEEICTRADGTFDVDAPFGVSIHLLVIRPGFATRVVPLDDRWNSPIDVSLSAPGRVRVRVRGSAAPLPSWWELRALVPGDEVGWYPGTAPDSDSGGPASDAGAIYDDLPAGPLTLRLWTPKRTLVRTVEVVAGKTVDCVFDE